MNIQAHGHFGASARATAGDKEKPVAPSHVLNYVWVSERKSYPPSPGEALCSIRLDDFDQAYANARNYPDTPINVWVDRDCLDEVSLFFLESHFYACAPGNVKLRNLRDIPDYDQNPVFNPYRGNDIWARVDLARLIVIQHCFDTMKDVQDVFYSDFDVPDVCMGDIGHEAGLAKYGMFCGLDKTGTPENSFFGFRRGEGRRFLKKDLLPATCTAASKDANGYLPMIRAVKRWGRARDLPNLITQIGIQPVPETTSKMPRNQFYIRHGICK